jgi:hypothetical protein
MGSIKEPRLESTMYWYDISKLMRKSHPTYTRGVVHDKLAQSYFKLCGHMLAVGTEIRTGVDTGRAGTDVKVQSTNVTGAVPGITMCQPMKWYPTMLSVPLKLVKEYEIHAPYSVQGVARDQ